MDQCLVSIIMPTYNRGYIIENAIQSVLDQTVSNWELIIVDDDSKDNTEEIVKAFADQRIIYIKNEENKGANYSRNRGCAAAKGKFLAFLDSDNIWNENMLQKQLETLVDSGDDVAFSFCKQEVIENENEISVFPDVEFDDNNFEEILRRSNVVDTNTVLLKKEIFEAVDGFDNDMPRIQDWELFFRIIVVYHYKAIFIPEILGTNILQVNSISSDNNKYYKALKRFLHKHYKYFTSDEIGAHFIFLGKIIKDGIKIGKYANDLEDLFSLFAQQIYKQSRYYDVLLNWKEKMEENKDRSIFSGCGMEDSVIALYGLGRWGELIYNEMSNYGIKIKFGIDKNVRQFHDLEIIGIDEIPESVDLVVVSVFQEFNSISRELSRYFSGKIISIEDLTCESKRNGEM